MSLQKVLKDSKDPITGVNLYEHLKTVLAKLMFDNPNDALRRFEEYSFELKGTKEEEVVFRVKESFNHLKDYEQRNRILLGVPLDRLRKSIPGRRNSRSSQLRSAMFRT